MNLELRGGRRRAAGGVSTLDPSKDDSKSSRTTNSWRWSQVARCVPSDASAEEVDAGVAQLHSIFDNPEAFARRLRTEGFTEESYRKQ